MKKFLFLIIAFSAALTIIAQDLEIVPGDAYIEFDRTEGSEPGFHLWIRQKPGLGSVLLTESSADPEKRVDSFAFRAYEYNEINGDEKRILNGEILESETTPLYFLLDSTPEYSKIFDDQAFHIFVPQALTYGYPWSREGQVEVRQGTWLNIRTFEKQQADYTGAYKDNPFVLSMKELPPPPAPVEEKEVWDELADETDGLFQEALDGDEAVEKIGEIIQLAEGKTIDIVLVIDTTISMKNDVNFIKKKLIPLVKEKIADFEEFRIGIVLYRDYKEAYLTKEIPFETNLDIVQARLNRITVSGGRDLPEAVYEGIYSGIINFEWNADSRLIIQIGDALPHETPKGVITKEMVFEEADNLGISIYPILLPADNG